MLLKALKCGSTTPPIGTQRQFKTVVLDPEDHFIKSSLWSSNILLFIYFIIFHLFIFSYTFPGRLHDMEAVAHYGGIVRIGSIFHTMLGIDEMIDMIENKTVTGFLIDKNTGHHFTR